MKNKIVIAIDGIAGAGKSTVAKLVARKLKIMHFNTGNIYRAIGLKFKENPFDLNNNKMLTKFVENLIIKITYEFEEQHTYLDDVDVTEKLHTSEISTLASIISPYKEIRNFVVNIQRKISGESSIVIEGRDVGTYVLPQADFKFYLTANLDIRTERRILEYNNSQDGTKTFDELKKEIGERDNADTSRKFRPLKKADDAILIDTSYLSIDDVVKTIIKIIKGKK